MCGVFVLCVVVVCVCFFCITAESLDHRLQARTRVKTRSGFSYKQLTMRFELAVASAQDGIDVYEVHSGTLLRSIVLHNNAGTFATLGDEYLINYQNDKAFVQIFSWKTGAMQIRSIVPEKLTSIAISNSQSYVVGGTGTGKVYVWSLGNGELVNCFHAHYKKAIPSHALCVCVNVRFGCCMSYCLR